MIEKALEIAEKAHAGQVRKWGTNEPFIVHPKRVAEKVRSLPGMTEIDIAAALLHDVLEDCEGNWAVVIENECGKEVLDLVKELTYPTEGKEWSGRSRAEKNVIRYEHTRKMSKKAQRLKMVDRWDNLRDMVGAPHKLKQKYLVESKELLNILRHVDLVMAGELESAIHNLAKGI